MFPCENYRDAVVKESETRNVGVDVIVLDVEKSDNGVWMLHIEPLGKCDTEIEEGNITERDDNGVEVFSGEIVSFDADDGILMTKPGAVGMPLAGSTAKLMPPDYLKALREFATSAIEERNSHPEADERFMNLRDELLAGNDGTDLLYARNPGLRGDQNDALAMALRRRFSFVWGPPGTGKSYTLGHIVAELVDRGNRVLVLSNTNSAVDMVTFAIDDAFNRNRLPLAIGDMIRYARDIFHAEEYGRRPHLLAFTRLLESFAKERHEKEKELRKLSKKFAKLDRGNDGYLELAAKRAAVVTEIREIDSRRRDEIAVLLKKAKIVCASITCCLYNKFQFSGFDAIVVDEGSLTSLAVWPALLHGNCGCRFVVAGDPMQLIPIKARCADLDVHGWFDNNIYSYLGMSEYRSIARFIQAGSVTLLTEQSRMRKGICDIVSRMFYNGLVHGDRVNERIVWPDGCGIPNGDVAILDPGDAEETFGIERIPSNYCKNTCSASANVVMDCLRRMEGTVPADRGLTIEIITPFRNQAFRIYGYRLRGRDRRGNVRIGWSTIHCCQGTEADIVFLDLVNPSSYFLNGEDAAHLWCVACSRAKEQLIVVGDPQAIRSGRFSGPLFEKIPAFVHGRRK